MASCRQQPDMPPALQGKFDAFESAAHGLAVVFDPSTHMPEGKNSSVGPHLNQRKVWPRLRFWGKASS